MNARVDIRICLFVAVALSASAAIGCTSNTDTDAASEQEWASAEPGTLDTTFGDLGKLTTNVDLARDTFAHVLQDGSTLVSSTVAHRRQLTKVRPDGSLDPAFGTNGAFTAPALLAGGWDWGGKIFVREDGTIVVAGRSQAYNDSHGFYLTVSKHLPDGTLDTSWGKQGVANAYFRRGDYQVAAIVEQTDGKLVVAGSSFGWDIQGKGLTDFAVARFDTHGSLDRSFGSYGLVRTRIGDDRVQAAETVSLLPDGSMIVAGKIGSYTPHVGLVRLRPDGSHDPSFGQGGKVETILPAPPTVPAYAAEVAVPNGVIPQPGGAFLVVGHVGLGYVGPWGPTSFFVARYTKDGTLDTSFGTNGHIRTPFAVDVGIPQAAASTHWVRADGSFILAGSLSGADPEPYDDVRPHDPDFILAAYRADGKLDTQFGDNGIARTDVGGQDAIVSIAPTSNGRLIVAGTSRSSTGYTHLALAQYKL